ncbi:MAG: hypothetical protein ABSC89_11650 [Verrucomicrobiota bacterium]|jgi:hypothetical protein
MNLTRDEVKRLAFAKYLLSLGKRQIKLHEPFASVSLLLFHDATDHLLGLVSERVGSKENKEFMEYWKLINGARPGYVLPDRVGMERFNRARVALKHKGLQHSRTQLEEFQNLVESFFNKVIADIFQTTLDAVSICEFISNDKVRKFLKRAGESYERGETRKVRCLCALGFDELMKSSELPKLQHFFDEEFSFDFDYWYGSVPYVYLDEGRGADLNVEEFFKFIKKSLNGLQDRMRIISMGIDFRLYARFHSITPRVEYSWNRKRKISERGIPELTHQDVEFCIEFVTDVALNLQDRSFTVPTYNSSVLR